LQNTALTAKALLF